MTRHLSGVTAVLAFLLVASAAVGQVPADWTYRLDAEQSLTSEASIAPGQWRYERMPPGWHVTTTEQGVTLFPRERYISGRWGIRVELFLFPNPSDAPLGVVVEAADRPDGDTQLRFLMRRDGMAALVGRHAGTDTTLVGWTSDSTVSAHAGGVVKYILQVAHESGVLTFSVNGAEMFAVPTGGEDHRARPGLRIGAGLNVHVSRFDLIVPLAPPAPRP